MQTPPGARSPTYTPKIQVTHPNVPDLGSQRQLMDTAPTSPPYHGQDNPVFTFDKDSLFQRAPSRVDPIPVPPPAESPALRSLPPLRRGSYSPFLPATDKDSLTVPAFGVRRQSLSSSLGRESGGGGGGGGGMSLLPSPHRKPRPLLRLSIDNVTSDLRAQAIPSPGLLSTWSGSDFMGTPAPPDLETASKHRLSVPREGTASIFSSETDLLYRSSSELLSIPPSSFCTSSLSNVSGSLGERMHELVRAFSARTQRCKERISQPPTPSSTSSGDAKSAVSEADECPQAQRTHRLGSFLPAVSTTSDVMSEAATPRYFSLGSCRIPLPRCCTRLPHTMESYSKVYLSWLFVVTIAYMYNSTVIPLRGVFPYQTADNWRYWLLADYLSDLVYLTDIVIFKTRLRFTHEGVVETDYHQTKKHYIKKLIFKLDMLSLLPLDIFYLTTDQPWLRQFVWLRLPRMLKIQTFWEFYARCDQAAKSSAHVVRIVKTMTYMLYLIHIETCGYYAVSEYEGLNTNRWVYNNQGNAYIRCFYLATKTSTSIGNNPKPTNTLEYMFMTLYWLSGVFVFALLIGQIRDIVEAAGQVKTSYRKKMDDVLHYMQSIQISDYTQDRTRQWFLYNWEQSKTIDERSLVAALPKKLQTDLAISVHFNTLIKVQLFQDCERNLLYDLVLKLKPNLFLPGDYVCQKGEVGKEMYIVSQGQVEVVGGEKKDVVLATLSEGSVFGEISLLAMSGRGNRRTADVRSSGFTSVFTLSKNDFEEAMNEYPEAQKLLKKRAKKLLKENAKKMEKNTAKVETEEIIKTPHETPKMVRTVIQVMDPGSQTAQKLNLTNKFPATPSGARRLAVPEPGPKTLKVPGESGMGHSNLAFDLSDEQLLIKPSIVTQSYDDNDFLMDNDDEIIVIERTEESLPQSADIDRVVEDILNDNDDDDDSDDSVEERFMDTDAFVEDDASFEQEFFNSVMAELKAQDVIGDYQNTSPPEANPLLENDNIAPQNKAVLHNGATSQHEKTVPQEDATAPQQKQSVGEEVLSSMLAQCDNMATARNEIIAPQSENTAPLDHNAPDRAEESVAKTREAKKNEKTTGTRSRVEEKRQKQLQEQNNGDALTKTSPHQERNSSQMLRPSQKKEKKENLEQNSGREREGDSEGEQREKKERGTEGQVRTEEEEKDKETGNLEKDIADGMVRRVEENNSAKCHGNERSQSPVDSNQASTQPAPAHHHQQEGKAEEGTEGTEDDADDEGQREGEKDELSAASVPLGHHVVTVGIGGVSAQELSPLSSERRRRKVSTITQPRLTPDPKLTHTPSSTLHSHRNPLTPIEASGKGDNLLGGLGAPPTGHVTSAVHLHQQNVITAPAIAASAAGGRSQKEATLSSPPTTNTTTTVTTTAEICLSARPTSVTVPTSASPLTPDLSDVGESVV